MGRGKKRRNRGRAKSAQLMKGKQLKKQGLFIPSEPPKLLGKNAPKARTLPFLVFLLGIKAVKITRKTRIFKISAEPRRSLEKKGQALQNTRKSSQE